MLSLKTLIAKILAELKENIPQTYYITDTNMRTGRMVFTRKAGIVYMSAPNDFVKLPAGQYSNIGTLPQWARPITEQMLRVQNNRNMIMCNIRPDGTVRFYNYDTAITTDTNGAFSGCWIAG